MSEDLIKRSDAIKALCADSDGVAETEAKAVMVCLADVLEVLGEVLGEVPSADRPQGEWKPFDLTWGRSIYACSVCEEAIAVPCGWSDGKPIYDYCPMCGARMKGADDDR